MAFLLEVFSSLVFLIDYICNIIQTIIMIKKELISEVHKDLKNAGLVSNISESQLIFDTVMNVLSNNISKGKDINISNFGNFYSKPVRRINPRDPSKTFRKFTVYFTASKTIKNKLNGV